MSSSPESDKIFSTILQPAEKLLWTGCPNPDEAAKRSIPLVFFGIIWTAMVSLIAGMGIWSSISGKLGSFGIVFSLFTLPFLAIGIFLLTSPFWAKAQAKKNRYALTDRRAIIIDQGKKPTYQAYDLSDLGAPFIVGGRKCPDIFWTVPAQVVSVAQPLPQLPTGSSRLSTNVAFTSQPYRSTGTTTSSQSDRFEFTCLSDAEAAFDIANNQKMLIEREKLKADPLGLNDIKTFSSGGKLFVMSGFDMYEFDGIRATNRKSLLKYALFVIAPIILSVITILGLNLATSLIKANGSGIFGVIQPIFFLLFMTLMVTNVFRGGHHKRISTAIGAQHVDFSNAKVLERLQTLYAEQGGSAVVAGDERGFFSKLLGYIVGAAMLGFMATVLLMPIWVSYQELQKALHPQPIVQKTLPERISDLRKQVARSEKTYAESVKNKQFEQRNLNTLVYRRECLAAAQIEGSLPADAAESYAKALPERYQQLEEASTKEAYDTVLLDVGRDAVWYADCLRDAKRLDEINFIAPELTDKIEKTSRAKHFDVLAEKKVLINQMTLALKKADYDQPEKDTNKKLKELENAPAKTRDAAYNQLIAVLLDSMK